MSMTFTTLCGLADFTGIPKSMEKEKLIEPIKPKEPADPIIPPVNPNNNEISLKYSINIELPSTRDKLIYDAIFKSIKENLL